MDNDKPQVSPIRLDIVGSFRRANQAIALAHEVRHASVQSRLRAAKVLEETERLVSRPTPARATGAKTMWIETIRRSNSKPESDRIPPERRRLDADPR